MATILLQGAGATLGGALGGPLGAVLGRAAGAIAGNFLDRRIFGEDRVIEGARLEEARILGSSDGAPMPRVYGRVRIGGQLIWATRFEEVVSAVEEEEGGGKGGAPSTTTEEYSYFANFAVALCEGSVSHFGRIWADGVELDRTRYEIRFYKGGEGQQPDPLIEAKQGASRTPAYRGIAYAVFEAFPLEAFGNRIPQLSFEVVRSVARLDRDIKAVTIIPGSTEFGYSPQQVRANAGEGETRIVNRNCLVHSSDWRASVRELLALCPNLQTVALVVAWFGDDLRAAQCQIRPGVEYRTAGGEGWQVNGVPRSAAREVSRIEDRPAYGGTPSDDSVIAAIRDLKARGLEVILYPFVMMDIAPANSLPDPHGGPGAPAGQPAFPWRGRITCDPAPSLPGSADGTAAAANQIAAFCGDARAADYSVSGDEVAWTGGADWGYRRMILHYAHLAEAAGGIDGFLIGSEFVGLTQVRDNSSAFPFVEELRDLAADMRSILRPATKITYAADWSEYFGYHPQDGSGDLYFHLDRLWAHPAIDAIGIDNYMPLGDWRGSEPQEAAYSPHDIDHLRSQIAGGEGFDWFYASAADRDAGIRTPITDGQGEEWVWRFKDLKSWWSNRHHQRVGGVRSPTPTPWIAQSKPIWFTELGCPAVTMGANQPNVFFDPKSAQSALPYFSTGARSDITQNRFLQAHFDWWDPATAGLPPDRNPVSDVFGGRMVDNRRILPWAWDARPFPEFPANTELWSDGDNWHLGHWLNGRIGGCPLDDLIRKVAGDFGLDVPLVRVDGFVDGYLVAGPVSPRQALEPLLTLAGAQFSEEGGRAQIIANAYAPETALDASQLCEEGEAPLSSRRREAAGALPAQAELGHATVLGGYESAQSHSRRLERAGSRILSLQMPVVMPPSAAIGAMEALLRDTWTGRETLDLALPHRFARLSPGDLLRFSGGSPQGLWRIESIEDGNARRLQLRRVSRMIAEPVADTGPAPRSAFAAQRGKPVLVLMNLPLGAEEPGARIHFAIDAKPWAKRYSLWSSPSQSGFSRRAVTTRRSVIGTLLEDVQPGPEGRWDLASSLRVRLVSSGLSSAEDALVLNGRNAAAVQCNDGGWEILQFALAQLDPDGNWELRRLLRAQAGSDGPMRSGADAGSRFVLLNANVRDLQLRGIENGLQLNWRCGPAGDPVSGESFTGTAHQHQPVNRMALSPVHLSARRTLTGDIALSWIRRSRIDADGWDLPETPIGETQERYRVSILSGSGALLRQFEAPAQTALYTQGQQMVDFSSLAPGFTLEVAQYSSAGEAGTPRRASFSF
jgi:hypothetical protein